MFSVVPVHVSAAKLTWLESFMFKGLRARELLTSRRRRNNHHSAQFPSYYLRSGESAKVLRQRVYNESERTGGKISGGESARGREGRDRKARFDHRYS